MQTKTKFAKSRQSTDTASVEPQIDDLNDQICDHTIRQPCFPEFRNIHQENRVPEIANLMNQVRKWDFSFNGTGNGYTAVNFLERIEEHAVNYQIPPHHLITVLSVLVKGEAEDWYRCNKHMWLSWEDCKEHFKLFFVPARTRAQMVDDVRAYKQGQNQPFKKYVIAMQKLMRYVPEMSEEEQLDRIYRNLGKEFTLYIKRSEFSSISELMRLGEEHEEKLDEDKRSKYNNGKQNNMYHAQKNSAISYQNTYLENGDGQFRDKNSFLVCKKLVGIILSEIIPEIL
uniref:Retrotransposon gag domain-containing protein n=1 Tax=Megaselia scalaris TaxID=36166 RepID=T1GJZ2_MEGSC